jgi:hypothetical protein
VHRPRSRVLLGISSAIALLLGVAWTSGVPAAAAATVKASTYVPASAGGLDCNGFSPVQKPVRLMTCTDIRGSKKETANTDDGRFYDNGHYIGHDEPDAAFTSSAPGSGNNVNWTITLGRDPKAAPTIAHPGHDVSDWFELSIAPWVSMALCDPGSFPLTPCTPESDSNAPTCNNANCSSGLGGGSAFMEMQFYPPGQAPFVDNISCNNTSWCAAMNIDSLECPANFATNNLAACNPNCIEPVNFAFIQRNGVPTAPPSPQDQNVSTFVPNKETLMMNPGDTVNVHMFDAPAPGGGKAFEVLISDLTTHQTGVMQASAANGFQSTSQADCSGTPFNFQPEFNTAKIQNINSWGADQVNISTQFETGHWEGCTSLSDPIPNPTFAQGDGSTVFSTCAGPYEAAGPPDGNTPETLDSLCYLKGSTHPGYDGIGTSTAPNRLTGCLANFPQNGDIDFDGTPYWPEWPTSLTPGTYPGSFLELFPTTNGRKYSQFHFQTDLALSEITCGPQSNGTSTLSGCTVPPPGPGGFYPYWSMFHTGSSCVFLFGNVSAGNTFGKDAQYGTNQFNNLGYPQFISKSHNNPCA